MLSKTFSLLRNFIGVETNHTSHIERIVAGLSTCYAIALVAVVSQWSLPNSFHVLFFASSAATAYLVFALPHGALSQPWPVWAGQTIALLMGIGVSYALGNSMISAAIAVGLSVILMHYLHCLHPPGGATAFYFAYQVPPNLHWEEALAFELNIVVILVLAFVLNNLFRWRKYPVFWVKPAPQAKPADTHFEVEDLHHVLQQQDLFVDVSINELTSLYHQASESYQKRHTNGKGKA